MTEGEDRERSPVATVVVEPRALKAESAEITGDAYRHLFRARRLAVGDRLRAVDGAGQAREGLIVEVGRDRAQVELGSRLDPWAAPRHLRLIVAPPRPERASWLVEKATELGVAEIAWLATERTGRLPSAKQLERHRRVARAALEQCGRAALPTISGPHPWNELSRRIAGLDSWLLDPGCARPVAPGEAPERIALLVGPEGGWSDDERSELAALGATARTLGGGVLRVETAALAGAALLLTRP